MRTRLVLALILFAAFALPQLGPAARARGDGERETALDRKGKRGHCTCEAGQGSWEYLRSPMRPPDDPPRCGLLIAGGDCSNKARPKGVSAGCWGSGKNECFFKRHAYSWKIRCSECWSEEECDACDDLVGGRDAATKKLLEGQLALEGATDRDDYVLAISPHFYVLTDIHRKLKVPTKGGSKRVATAHEVAHLFAERCELAYLDFLHHFGGRVQLGKPMGVYITYRQRTAEDFANRYLGSPRTDMLYGGGSSRIAGGFCGNGFVGSLQESRSDEDLHAYCRHMIGHILFSCWLKVDPKEEACPKWAFIGAAHFMEKLLEPHRDYATFCSNESTAPSGSGKDWDRKARSLAARRLDPIETFFARESLAAFSYEDHVRAWSLMHLGLMEDNARWTKMLALLRAENDEGYAFKEVYGITSDDFHQRWVDRLRGGRDTMGEVREDAEEPDAPGRRERERIEKTDDPDVLAGMIRGVDTIADVEMAEVVVDKLDHPSDLVRETIHIVLSRTKDPEVLAWLVEEGLGHSQELSRAGVARAFGTMRHVPARPALEAMLDDRFWLARANAARALGQIGDEASLAPLVAALDERQDKAWMAIADAVASYGRRSKEATLATNDRLGDRHWQVRVVAAQALARYGTQEAMDPLIERFDTERGRLERELLRALRAVSGDNLGENPDTWRRWWEQQKERHGGFDPNAPPKPEGNPLDDRYGPTGEPGEDEPRYYGRLIYSRSVGFVFDVSSSMDKNITIPEGASTKLGDIRRTGTRMEIAKEVLAGTIRRLRPQARFNLVFFSSDVRPWKSRLVPATPGNTESAAGAVMNAPADGETNIHGALKAALGLHDKSTLEADLDEIPDTVYFLTDGSPTRGEITSAPELLGWFADLNRFARVRLHVVAFGNLGVDLDFLSALAEAGGGDFIHVPER